MPEKKIIAVVGATGAQGGGLVRAILEDPSGEFTARAITRDPNSDKAKALAKLGAEVVKGDVDDPESLKKAFEGAYGAFCVTFFWNHYSPERETENAKTQAEATKAAGVKHVIWSTLEDTRKHVPLDDNRMPTIGGNYKVPHFDAKGQADEFFKDVPATLLLTTFFWDNFIHFGSGPARGEDGNLYLTFPLADKKMAGIASEDIGRAALGIFKRPDLIGKTVGVAGEHLTGEQMAKGISKAIGQPVTYRAVEPDAYRALGFPGAEDLGNMFQYYRDFENHFGQTRDVDFARSVNPKLLSFDQWLDKYGNQIRVP
ncbi:MAG: hypothetical protein QOJ65_905 [Fimbriimonadaceae bacterium]|jgi:uncharacterized protein YbjT (DUF2867 family)|nr:hypothetical protein [Fimbriimonadaceae bacterium]